MSITSLYSAEKNNSKRHRRTAHTLLRWLPGYLLLFFSVIATGKENPQVVAAISVTPLSAPFVIAHELGYFSNRGLDIALKQYVGGHRAAEALFNGDADIATSSEAVAMFNSFKHRDFAIIATLMESDNDVKIITTRQTGIRTINDLAGRRVGTILGASAHFFLEYTLLMHGIDPESLDISAINPEQTLDNLQKNSLDAVVSWEPFIHQTKTKLGDDAIIVPHNHFYIETFNVLVKKPWAKQNQESIHAMLGGLLDATRYIQEQPLNSQRLVAKYFDMELAQIQPYWSDLRFSITLDQWLITALETEARWAINSGFIGAAGKNIPNYRNLLLVTPLNRLSPESVTVIR